MCFRILLAKRRGIKYLPPNFIFFPTLNSSSIVIDVGCGFDADLSCSLIKRYKVNAIVVDPTRKHKSNLLDLAKKYGKKFKYLQLALSKNIGKTTFYESLNNESGACLPDHVNILNDNIRSYSVDSVNLDWLANKIGKSIDLLKIDIEGAEYELLRNVKKASLIPFKQIFIEFHHHAIESYTYEDTLNVVTKFQNFGYHYFSIDNHNFLFFRP